jgi:hypothetical protein
MNGINTINYSNIFIRIVSLLESMTPYFDLPVRPTDGQSRRKKSEVSVFPLQLFLMSGKGTCVFFLYFFFYHQ